MTGRGRVSNVLVAAIGGSLRGPCRIWFWVAFRILVATLITPMTVSAGAVQPGEENRNRPAKPQIAVAPTLEVEPSIPTELYVRVDGPTDALPPPSYVLIDKLPSSVILSEGKKTSAGSWVVPLLVLERLKITATARLPQGSEFMIALVADGAVLVQRTVTLYVAPAVVAARPSNKVDKMQAPRIAAFTNSPVGSRAEAERLVSRGERHLADGNIVIARQYFLRASELGLGIAALKMAETYDARALVGLSVRGLMPDPAEATKWYERALELGAPEAQARLERLGRK
jgi:hypothetical protein